MTRSNDDWRLERSRRDARRLAEHNRRDQRLAFQLLTERVAKEVEPRRDDGPPPRID